MIKRILIWIVAYVLIMCMAIGLAYAGPLEDFKAGYENGTALIDKPDYAELYSRSSDRNIEF